MCDKYGIGNAAMVLEEGKMVDFFIDPPSSADFYPPHTFLRAIVDRKAFNLGGYFIKLPNGNQGFLKSKIKYKEGMVVIVMSQVISEPSKSQGFTDILKIVSKYFVIKIGKEGVFFSKKIPHNFEKLRVFNLLNSKIKNLDDVFVICRSSIADISFSEFDKEIEKALEHFKTIKKVLEADNIYYNGLARKVCLERYNTKFYNITEDEGIFERLGIWDKLEEIKEGRITHTEGSSLIFDQTSAFLTIDVNTGNNFSVSKRQINLSACEEIFRIIRAFGFGGKIFIDFLPSRKELREEILTKISLYFEKDTVKNKIWGWTKSGVFELERKRDKIPLKLLL